MSEISIQGLQLAFLAGVLVLHLNVAAETQSPSASIFDMSEMLDASTVNLSVMSDEMVAVEVREVAFEFFSHDWQSEALRHKAMVYMPAQCLSTHS